MPHSSTILSSPLPTTALTGIDTAAEIVKDKLEATAAEIRDRFHDQRKQQEATAADATTDARRRHQAAEAQQAAQHRKVHEEHLTAIRHNQTQALLVAQSAPTLNQPWTVLVKNGGGGKMAQPPALVGTCRMAETDLPVLLPFIGHGNLLVDAADSGGWGDLGTVILLRTLASAPPGSVRIDAIDFAGQGSAFSALLPFAETIRGREVVHDRSGIAACLHALGAHAAHIGQRCLGNAHSTLADYNADVGTDLAEPFRILAIAGFPSGFDTETAAEVLRLAANGPRAGIHLLVEMRRPDEDRFRRFDFGPLSASSRVIRPGVLPWEWASGASFTPHVAPSAEIVAHLASTVNDAARAVSHRAISLGSLLAGQPWAKASAAGLEVAVGRCGPDLHHLTLGLDGTAHHALITGTTGSGKTSAIHALILSGAHHYGPAELELYLVDFKEGVEFRPYVSLPHVRVVALEAERELGVSVLEDLQAQIAARAKRFTADGVKDLAGWRAATGGSLPRVLCVIDEFQRLFEEDDRLAAAARAVIDDIVRRGRSFGIHLVLASQSLGSGTLAPATLTNIGLRIALKQADRSQAERVLTEGNLDPLLLERPGEAIVNHAGGLRAANRRVQFAYAGTAELEQRVQQMAARAAAWGSGPRPSPLVESATAVALAQVRAHPACPANLLPLGAAVAVNGSPVGLRLRNQARANLLLLGQDPAQALELLSAAALTATAIAPGLTVDVISLLDVDDPAASRLAKLQGDAITLHHRRTLTAVLDRLHSEVVRREQAQAAGTAVGPSRLLVLVNPAASRDLEPADYKLPPPLAHLRALAARGPDVGLHLAAWIPTAARARTLFDARGLGEFGVLAAITGGDALALLEDRMRSPLRAAPLREAQALVVDEQDRCHRIRMIDGRNTPAERTR